MLSTLHAKNMLANSKTNKFTVLNYYSCFFSQLLTGGRATKYHRLLIVTQDMFIQVHCKMVTPNHTIIMCIRNSVVRCRFYNRGVLEKYRG